MLLSGPGVLNIGSPASFSGAAPPQRATSQRDGANGEQCRHREGLLEKEATSHNVQVLSGKTLSPPGPAQHITAQLQSILHNPLLSTSLEQQAAVFII